MIGLLLVSGGLLLISAASGMFTEEAPSSTIPPFEYSAFWAVISSTAILLTFFLFTTLIPWFMLLKKEGVDESDYSIKSMPHISGRGSETLEYIITTELPRELMNSVYVEADEDEVYVMSADDDEFFRSYPVPEGFEVGEIDYDYEGNYLVMKLILKRNA